MDAILWEIQSFCHERNVQPLQQHNKSMGHAKIQEAIPAKKVGYLRYKEHSKESAKAIHTLGTRFKKRVNGK